MRMTPFIPMLLFFAVLHLVPLLNMMGRLPLGGRAYLFVDTATAIPIALSLLYLAKAGGARGASAYTKLDWMVIAFGVYSLASFVLFLQPNNPSGMESFFYGVHLFVLPMACYFAAKTLTPTRQRDFVLALCLMNAFALLVGILLYYWRPTFYTAYLTSVVFGRAGFEEDWQIYSRLQSYLGSTAVSALGCTSIAILVIATHGYKLMGFLIPIYVVAVALSHQRAGMVGAVVGLLYLIFLNRRYVSAKLAGLAIALPLALALLAEFDTVYGNTLERLKERSTTDMLDAFYNRGYGPGFDYMSKFPFGVGLGGACNASDNAGLLSMGQVVDANFMRIGAELGVPGLFLFLTLAVTAFVSGSRRLDGMAWVTFLVIMFGICLGTNTLDSHLVSQYFWFLLGVMDSSTRFGGTALASQASISQRGDLGRTDPADLLAVAPERPFAN